MFLDVLSVECHPQPGSNIQQCCDEAARLADSLRIAVHFDFNGVFIRIEPFAVREEGSPPGLRQYAEARKAISQKLTNEVLADSADHPEIAVVISDDKIARFREPQAIFAFAEKTANEHLLPVRFTLRGIKVTIQPLDPSSARLEAAKWDFGALRSMLQREARKQ